MDSSEDFRLFISKLKILEQIKVSAERQFPKVGTLLRGYWLRVISIGSHILVLDWSFWQIKRLKAKHVSVDKGAYQTRSNRVSSYFNVVLSVWTSHLRWQGS